MGNKGLGGFEVIPPLPPETGETNFAVLDYTDLNTPHSSDHLKDVNPTENTKMVMVDLLHHMPTLKHQTLQDDHNAEMEERHLQRQEREELKAAIPGRFTVSYPAGCDPKVFPAGPVFNGNNSVFSLRITCEEDESVNHVSRCSDLEKVTHQFQKAFKTGLKKLGFTLLLELLKITWDAPVLDSSVLADLVGQRRLATVVWGVTVVGTVAATVDPMEHFRVKLRENFETKQFEVKREIKKQFEDMEDSDINAFLEDFKKNDAERQRKKKSGANLSEKLELDWSYAEGHNRMINMSDNQPLDEEGNVAKKEEEFKDDDWIKCEQQELEPSIAKIMELLTKAASKPENWRAFVSTPLIRCNNAMDHIDTAKILHLGGGEAKMFEHIQRAMIAVGHGDEVPTKAMDWMFARYKGKMDRSIRALHQGSLKQSSFEDSVKKTCNRMLYLICHTLIPEANSREDEDKIALLMKLRGDYLRYLCKFTRGGSDGTAEALKHGEKNAEVCEQSYAACMEHCKEASKKANWVGSPSHLLYITNAINFVLFHVEVKRDYSSAITLSQKSQRKVEKEEKREREKRAILDIPFEIPVANQLALMLLHRNARVLDSELVAVEVTFVRKAFKTVKKAIVMKVPELLFVDDKKTKKVKVKTEEERHRSATLLESSMELVGMEDVDTKQADEQIRSCTGVFSSFSQRFTKPPPELEKEKVETTQEIQESIHLDEKDVSAESIVALWLEAASMERKGLRWVKTIRQAEYRRGVFQILCRVNTSMLEKEMSALTPTYTLQAHEKHALQGKIAGDIVLGVINGNHGDVDSFNPTGASIHKAEERRMAVAEASAEEVMKTPRSGASDEKEEKKMTPRTPRSGASGEKDGPPVEDDPDLLDQELLDGEVAHLDVVPLVVESAQVVVTGPFCEVQEAFTGLDDAFMEMKPATELWGNMLRSKDYTWLIHRLKEFQMNQISKEEGMMGRHCHALSARRNPIQAAERGAR